jgi:hypothetical protein
MDTGTHAHTTSPAAKGAAEEGAVVYMAVAFAALWLFLAAMIAWFPPRFAAATAQAGLTPLWDGAGSQAAAAVFALIATAGAVVLRKTGSEPVAYAASMVPMAGVVVLVCVMYQPVVVAASRHFVG